MEHLTELSSNYFHLLPRIGSSELSSFCKLFYQNILFELCPEKSVFGSFKSDILNISRHKKHVIESRYMMGLSWDYKNLTKLHAVWLCFILLYGLQKYSKMSDLFAQDFGRWAYWGAVFLGLEMQDGRCSTKKDGSFALCESFID